MNTPVSTPVDPVNHPGGSKWWWTGPRLAFGAGPARLIDMRQARSAEVLRTWPQHRSHKFRGPVLVVAVDGFTGYANAVEQRLSEATRAVAPVHVVHLAADKLTGCGARNHQ